MARTTSIVSLQNKLAVAEKQVEKLSKARGEVIRIKTLLAEATSPEARQATKDRIAKLQAEQEKLAAFLASTDSPE